MIKAVLFDLDNTLIDREAAFKAAVRDAFTDEAVRQELLLLDGSGHGERAALFRRWEELSKQPMTQSILAHLLAEKLRCDDELLDELSALSKSLKIGIVSNGGGSVQRIKMRAAGLESVFMNRIWLSGEVGVEKPNALIFQLAAHALDESPEACVYVGDHPEIDFRGAIAAGMRAQLVNEPLTAESLKKLIRRERAR